MNAYEQQLSNGVQKVLAYIDSYWEKITFRPQTKKINRQIIDIPHRYIAPNHKKFSFIFYWDSFFMFKGLLGTEREIVLKDHVENFLYLYETYHVIPNFNAPASMGRTQPPFLSSMILDTYFALTRTKEFGRRVLKTLVRELTKRDIDTLWLSHAMEVAKNEYFRVWIDAENKYYHFVPSYKLNRYGDRDIGYAHSSELESGWDFTSRFYNRCDEFLPIDLNVYLYKYEIDFAKASLLLEKDKEAKQWQKTADERKKRIQEYMWNPNAGFYFDFDFKSQKQSEFLSLAGFTHLWAGIAPPDQAAKMRKNLMHFETPYGLTITDKKSLAPQIDLSQIPEQYRKGIEAIIQPKQWDYPNIWPPLEYLTVIGLLRYGFTEDAHRIMQKSIAAQVNIFEKYHRLFEKLNGETGEKTKDFHYPTQAGFGWTNAIFYRYTQILKAIEKESNLYELPKAQTPPFELAILH